MMPGRCPLWVVRHARPAQAVAGCYGATDISADPVHTQALARQLAGVLPGRARLFVSGLRRAQQLVDGVLALRPDLSPATVDRRLDEMDFGAWENRTWDDIGQPALEAWTRDFAHHRCGGGESVADVLERVHDAWLDMGDAPEAPSVVWFTHAGVIRALQYLSAHAPGRWAMPTSERWPAGAVEHGACLRIDAPIP